MKYCDLVVPRPTAESLVIGAVTHLGANRHAAFHDAVANFKASGLLERAGLALLNVYRHPTDVVYFATSSHYKG